MVTSSPHLKRRGLPPTKVGSRFLLDSISVLSINRLTPCVPRFYDKFVGKTDFALFIPDWLQVIEVNLSESLIMGGMITPNPFSFLYSLYSRLGSRSIGVQAHHERQHPVVPSKNLSSVYHIF